MKRADILSKKITFKEKINMFYRLKRLLHHEEMGSLFNQIICTETGIKKSMCCKKIAKLFFHSNVLYNKNIESVFIDIRKKTTDKDLICILGSHYFGPHIYKAFNKSFAKI